MFELSLCVDESAFRVTRVGLSSHHAWSSVVLLRKGTDIVESDLGW
jgi:hypothetical protein